MSDPQLLINLSRKRQGKLMAWLNEAAAKFPPRDVATRDALLALRKEFENNLALPADWLDKASIWRRATNEAEEFAQAVKSGPRLWPVLAMLLCYYSTPEMQGKPVSSVTVDEILLWPPRYIDFMRKLLSIRPPPEREVAEHIMGGVLLFENETKAPDFRARIEAEIVYIAEREREREAAAGKLQ